MNYATLLANILRSMVAVHVAIRDVEFIASMPEFNRLDAITRYGLTIDESMHALKMADAVLFTISQYA